MNEPNPVLKQVTRVAQIIKLALASGVATFGIVAILATKGADDGTVASTQLYIMLATVLSAIVARLVVPSILISNARKRLRNGTWQVSKAGGQPLQTDTEKLTMAYYMQMIVGSAILEGAAFMCVFTHMMQKDAVSLIAALLLLVGLLADFPTAARVQNWVERQNKLLQEEKMLAGTRS